MSSTRSSLHPYKPQTLPPTPVRATFVGQVEARVLHQWEEFLTLSPPFSIVSLGKGKGLLLPDELSGCLIMPPDPPKSGNKFSFRCSCLARDTELSETRKMVAVDSIVSYRTRQGGVADNSPDEPHQPARPVVKGD